MDGQATSLLTIDNTLRYVLYGISVALDVDLRATEIERLFEACRAGVASQRDYVFHTSSICKVVGRVDEHEPGAIHLSVFARRFDQQALQRLIVAAQHASFGRRADASEPPDALASRLNLVVLRVADLERATAFYRCAGLPFTKHAHGSGPLHYASEVDGFVFELYLATPEQSVSSSARIGLKVADVDEIVSRLRELPGAKIISPPKDSEWGRRAVLVDPDGHRVELIHSHR